MQLLYKLAHMLSSNDIFCIFSLIHLQIDVLFNFCNRFAVTAVDLKQTVLVDRDLQIRAYYAGHVWFKLFICTNTPITFHVHSSVSSRLTCRFSFHSYGKKGTSINDDKSHINLINDNEFV